MKTKFIKSKFKYDGTQLSPLFTYLNFKILGNSILSWIGPCQIDAKNMVDGEDFIANEKICGSLMLHFIIECFDRDLFSGVCLQRLLAAIVKDYFFDFTTPSSRLFRSGDDLYCKFKSGTPGKLSISISSQSSVSNMIHFAINISNEGTPVKTASLNDLGLTNPEKVAKDIMKLFADEYISIAEATQKVRPL